MSLQYGELRPTPQQLWRSVNTLMGRGDAPVSKLAAVSPDEAHQFFDYKVANVRASTADAPPPYYSTAPQEDCRFTSFSRLTIDDVTAAVQRLPDKHCMSDMLQRVC